MGTIEMTEPQVRTLTTLDLLRILGHDRPGEFARTTINIMTASGTVYQFTLLPGTPVLGGLKDKAVFFRNVEYIRTERGKLPDAIMRNQFIHFDGTSISLYSALPSLPRPGETQAQRDARDDEAIVSTPVRDIELVIDWNIL